MTGLIIGFGGYLVLMLVIGIVCYLKDKDKSIEGFIVGDRNFGAILTSLGMSTTLASGYAFIGLVGAGYLLGSIALWQPILCTISEFVLWYFLAKHVHDFSRKTNALTPVELLSRIKGDPGNLIKILGGAIVAVFILVYLAGQFVSGAKAATIFNIDFTTAAVLSAALVMVYTMLGGVRAVMWTDAIQGVMMVVCFIVIVVTALYEAGGFANMVNVVANVDPHLIMWNNGKVGMALVLSMCTWIGIAFGFLGQPQAIQKFMTMRSDKSIRGACVLSVIFNTVRQYFPIIIGLCGRVIFPDLKDPEMVIPYIIRDSYPGIFGGLLLASIFSAIMSTTDSLLLQSTSEISRNVLQLGFFRNKNVSDKSYGFICKVLTIVMAAIGLYLALAGSGNVFQIIGFSFAGLTCSVAPAMFFGFLWKKVTSWGILASLVTGIPAVAIWYLCFKKATGLHEGIVGMAVAVTATVLVSLATYKEDAPGEYVAKA